MLDKTYPIQGNDNIEMGIHCMAIDTGGEEGVTDNAYKFWRQCKKEGLARRVYLFKGMVKRKASSLLNLTLIIPTVQIAEQKRGVMYLFIYYKPMSLRIAFLLILGETLLALTIFISQIGLMILSTMN